MNTDNIKAQQLYGEPLYVEGTAGKKQVGGEPQFVSGLERHPELLTPIYIEPQHGARDTYTGQEQRHGVQQPFGEFQHGGRDTYNTGREQRHGVQQPFGEFQHGGRDTYHTGQEQRHGVQQPFGDFQHGGRDTYHTGQEQRHGVQNTRGGEEWQKIPIVSEREQLYPGQERFTPENEHFTSGGTQERFTAPGNEHFNSGRTNQTGELTKRTERDQLYPGQEKFTTPGNEHFNSGRTDQTGELTKRTEHLSLTPDKEQHAHLSDTEHVHLKPTEHVHLTPDAGHIHISAENAPGAGVEQVIRIKPDGRVLVTAEKSEEHLQQHTQGSEHFQKEHGGEHLKEHRQGTEHFQKEHGTPLQAEHGTGYRKDYEPSHTMGLHQPHEHKQELGTGYRKDYNPSLTKDLHKPHVEHDTGYRKDYEHDTKHHYTERPHETTETQTVVKIKDHEPGTAGYTKEGKLGKHDDRDKHHDTTEHKKTGKTHSDKGKHGKDENLFGHKHGNKETEVTVAKEHRHVDDNK